MPAGRARIEQVLKSWLREQPRTDDSRHRLPIRLVRDDVVHEITPRGTLGDRVLSATIRQAVDELVQEFL